MALLLLVICLPSVLAALTAANPIHIPISRSTRRPRTTNDHIAEAERTRRRYSFRSSDNFNGINIRTQDFPLADQGADSGYYCTISIGIPVQSFNLLVDTASPYTWVADTSCSGCPDSMQLYDPSTSELSIEGTSATLTYGSVTVSGTVMTDTLELGLSFAISQNFLGATAFPATFITGSVSGILGLALQSTTIFGTPVFPNLDLFPTEVMSFQLNRFAGIASAQEEEANGGVFTLGGSNATLYSGAIDFVAVVEPSSAPTYWMIHLSSITVQGKSVPVTAGASALATFNTASGLIGGPAADVSAIWAAVLGAVRSTTDSGFYEFPCSTNINMSVSFGSRSWPINSKDLNLGPISTDSSQCLGAIFQLNATVSQNSPSWDFGAAFLTNVYTVFRANPYSVGFAELSSQALGESPTGSLPTGSLPTGSLPTSAPSNSQKSGSSISPAPIAGGVGGFSVVVFIAILWWRVAIRNARKNPVQSAMPKNHPEILMLATTQLSSPSSPGKEFAPASMIYSRVESPPLGSSPNPVAAGVYFQAPSTVTSPPLNPLHPASGFVPQQRGPWPSSAAPDGSSPHAGYYSSTLTYPQAENIHFQSSETSYPASGFEQHPPASSLPSRNEIQEIRRASDAEADTTFRRRETHSSFSSEPTTPPMSEYSPSKNFTQATYSPTLPPSLSDMKGEQNAAAHHYGAQHTASDVLVHTPEGLQLSPGFTSEQQGPSSYQQIGRPIGRLVGHDSQRPRHTSVQNAATTSQPDVPPSYSRYSST